MSGLSYDNTYARASIKSLKDTYTLGTEDKPFGGVVIANDTYYQALDAGGVAVDVLGITSGNVTRLSSRAGQPIGIAPEGGNNSWLFPADDTLRFNTASGSILANTGIGVDTSTLVLSGAGDAITSRGALAFIEGNQAGGNFRLYSGNIAGATLDLNIGHSSGEFRVLDSVGATCATIFGSSKAARFEGIIYVSTGQGIVLEGTSKLNGGFTDGAVLFSNPSGEISEDPSAISFNSSANVLRTDAIRFSTAIGITAAGTTVADATQLSATVNRVDTVAASTGVKLRDTAGLTGLKMVVMNLGVNDLKLYPSDGSGSINGAASGAGITLAAASNDVATCYQVGSGAWVCSVGAGPQS